MGASVRSCRIDLAQDERMSPATRTLLQHSVSVRLSTDKATYSANEQPLLRMEVVNVGAQPLYFYPTSRLGYDGDGVFRIYVQPARACPGVGGKP